jgi:hypothetical protein
VRLDAVAGGQSPYNRVFEFNYSINGHACRMLVTSVTGHLMELEFEDPFLPPPLSLRRSRSWSPASAPPWDLP